MTFAPSPQQNQLVARAGRPLAEATGAMILVHGRGATAASILQLSSELAHPELSYLAPQAAGNSWYPYSFLAPIAQNQPGLDSGLARLADLVAEVTAAGIPAERLILAGFSQGACLSAEFVARNPRRYGGLLIFSGGVIGPPGMARDDKGDLAGTPVFIGCSDVDAHIPLARVQETSTIMRALGGNVTERIYPGMPHTIIQPEIDEANQIVGTLFN
jgi:predicted esterase